MMHARTLATAAVLAAVVGSLAAMPAAAQVSTQDQALAMAFPDADSIVRRTAYLTPDELEQARELAGSRVEFRSGIVTHYMGLRGGRPVGAAYFDAHRVRTLDEVLMVVVDSDGGVRRVETVSFREPPEYEAPEGWLELFRGRELDDELSLKGEIPTLTGATLTAGAVTEAVRRVLALHQVIDPFSTSETAAR